ncbi:MAG TPA: N-acetylmuramoyl-L-alanine amidase [Firmicutes bacterium]|jgi:N-acetylmuramoyl-L-alanine amidase|nr:N-acetylmuramoyl-L-alanine amidase [Bacillota bacterium]HHT42430.1 N-acetylmuramoyl-L-alanine amidase [Bacillota bacterium]
MSRLYILVIPRNSVWFLLAALGIVVLLSMYHHYPFGLYALSLVHQEVIYDIMLDPGHGGIDSGAVGAGDIYEKHYVLDIVLQMAELLEAEGLRVGLTRDTDRDVSHLVSEGTRHRRDLLGRFKLMNQAHLGMSVHANAAKDAGESGAIVFYMKDRYAGQIYAQLVLEELEKVQVLNEAAPIPRSTLLLLKARPPVVLVEIGFMSNPTDLAKLGDPQFRTAVARALCQGILNYWEWASGEQSETSP